MFFVYLENEKREKYIYKTISQQKYQISYSWLQINYQYKLGLQYFLK